MFNSETTPDRKPHLDNLVRCICCGARLTRDGESYLCPNQDQGHQTGCLSEPVEAQLLTRRVLLQIIKTVINDDVVEDAVNEIQQEANKKAETQRNRWEHTEAKLSELNRQKRDLLEPVENKVQSFTDIEDELSEINQVSAGLAYEALVARKELESLEFAAKEEGIRRAAREVETYLDSTVPDDVQKLLEMLVKKVEVGSKEAVVIYHDRLTKEGITKNRGGTHVNLRD